MAARKIKLKDQLGRVVRVPTATAAPTPTTPTVTQPETARPVATVWKLIREIPANIQKLANLVGNGFTTRGPDGEWYQRSIAEGEGIAVTNGDGVDGDPGVALAELADAGGGTLQKTLRDDYGRVAGTSDATTSDLAEGDNLYYTNVRADARAAAAVTAHVAAADPHPQYTTTTEAAAAAPVQSVNAKTGAVMLTPSDIGLASGTAGQFWRGDGAWSSELLGDMTFRSPSINNSYRKAALTPSVSGESLMGLNGYGATGATEALGGTLNFRTAEIWAPTANGCNFEVRLVGPGTTSLAVKFRVHGDGAVAPASDNQQLLGAPSSRWKEAWVASGTISPSDAREKTPVRPFTPAELAAAAELGREIGAYQWLAMVVEKGDAARQHIGMTVQGAISVLESHGLDPFVYGFICYDTWDELPEVQDEAGEIVQAHRPAGDRYSFRMDELAFFIAAGEREARRQSEIIMLGRLENLERAVG